MSRSALILAAHGSRLDPSTNASVRRCADRLAGLVSFDEVAAAFHHGQPTFATVLDRVAADNVTVVPFMTSNGYFSEVVLPRELARNACYRDKHVRRTPPVGGHPDMIRLVVRRVRHRLQEFDLDPGATTLAVVGHGTERHRRSRVATVQLAGALRRRKPCREVLHAFLDEPPHVDTLLERATGSQVVVIPFLIGGGPHATRDIPAALGLPVPQGATPPFVGRVGHRMVVCDAAIGTDPDIVNVVADLAESGPGRQEE